MVPEGEEAGFTYELASDDLLQCKIILAHDEEEEKKKSKTINVVFEDQLFTITFRNFDSSLGHSTTNPVVFGQSNKAEELSFLASVFKFKAFTKIEIQLMIGKGQS